MLKLPFLFFLGFILLKHLWGERFLNSVTPEYKVNNEIQKNAIRFLFDPNEVGL